MHKLRGWLARLAGVVVVITALVLVLPGQAPAPGVSRPAGPVAPAGCRPVAPGAYTSICESSDLPSATTTAATPKAPEGCRPVAPGAYTSICEDTGTTVPVDRPEPISQAVCRPVAPGAYTSICIDP